MKVEIDLETKEGETALALASAGGSVGIVKMILEKGANINKCVLHQAVKL